MQLIELNALDGVFDDVDAARLLPWGPMRELFLYDGERSFCGGQEMKNQRQAGSAMRDITKWRLENADASIYKIQYKYIDYKRLQNTKRVKKNPKKS